MRALFVFPLVLSTGCALVSGLSGLDVGTDDAGPVDASEASTPEAAADAGPDVVITFDAATCGDGGCGGIASPWSPVGRAATTCPKGWTSLDYVTNPSLGSACACGCTVATPPTCDVGACTITAGTSPACSLGTLTLNFNGPNCLSTPPAMLVAYHKVVPIDAKGGTCTAAPNPNGVVTTPARLCAPADCDTSAALCGGSVPSGVTACVVAPGDLACPSSYPVRSAVGLAAAAACSSACSCQVNGTCSMGKLSSYSDTQCATLVVTSDANGTCTADPAAGTTVRSAKYAATVSATCSASGNAAGTVGLVGLQTLCCRP